MSAFTKLTTIDEHTFFASETPVSWFDLATKKTVIQAIKENMFIAEEYKQWSIQKGNPDAIVTPSYLKGLVKNNELFAPAPFRVVKGSADHESKCYDDVRAIHLANLNLLPFFAASGYDALSMSGVPVELKQIGIKTGTYFDFNFDGTLYGKFGNEKRTSITNGMIRYAVEKTANFNDSLNSGKFDVPLIVVVEDTELRKKFVLCMSADDHRNMIENCIASANGRSPKVTAKMMIDYGAKTLTGYSFNDWYETRANHCNLRDGTYYGKALCLVENDLIMWPK